MTPAKRFPKAFIIRPFGEKEIVAKDPAAGKLKINFDDVETQLIKPAMAKAGLTGDTTQEFFQSGSIPRDMFQRLLTAELVIADISIHNANVFYELGIRHALRDKRTFLLRCNVEGHEMPFDIRTERYLIYDRADPAKAVESLVRGLQATVESEQYDSPMYGYLPDLVSQDVSQFIRAPEGFAEKIRAAENERQIGDLQFFAEEVASENWGLEGLRLAARAQVRLGAWLPAARIWEQVRTIRGQDTEADLNLGRVYTMAERYQEAKNALLRLRATPLTPELRARASALLGDNASRRWVEEWRRAAGKPYEAALRSPALRECWQCYLEAFESDLHDINHGTHALLAGTVLVDLANRQGSIWKDLYDDDDVADAELKTITRLVKGLPAALELALGKSEEREKAKKLEAGSVRRCQAELSLATSAKSGPVADKYRRAVQEADRTVIEQMRERLLQLRDLGVFGAKVQAALDAIDEASSRQSKTAPPPAAPEVVAVFLGMDEGALAVTDEAALRKQFQSAIQNLGKGGKTVLALGGGSPAEIVFHEVCEGLLLDGTVCVSYDNAESRAAYEIRWSANWKARYDALVRRRSFRALQDGPDSPAWLPPGYNVRARTSQWILHNALQHGCEMVLFVPASSAAGAENELADLLSRFRQTPFNVIRLALV